MHSEGKREALLLRCCGPRAVGAVVKKGRAGFVHDNVSVNGRNWVLNEVVGSMVEAVVGAN